MLNNSLNLTMYAPKLTCNSIRVRARWVGTDDAAMRCYLVAGVSFSFRASKILINISVRVSESESEI